jgi:hypothetical protein
MFLTKSYARVVTPALAHPDPTLPKEVVSASPLGPARRAFDHAIDDVVEASHMVAA